MIIIIAVAIAAGMYAAALNACETPARNGYGKELYETLRKGRRRR